MQPRAAARRAASRERVGQCEGFPPMLPLHHESWFTFRFSESRIIPRFHLAGVPAGQRVAVYRIDPVTEVRLGLLATASADEGGWVDLAEPIIVRSGDAFVVVSDAPK